MTEFKRGDMVRRTNRDIQGRLWCGEVMAVSHNHNGEIMVTVRWYGKPAETWFYTGSKLAEIELNK